MGHVWPFRNFAGTLRSEHIPEENRAGVMNLFRVPLNAFVVIVLVKVSASWRVLSVAAAARWHAFLSRFWAPNHSPLVRTVNPF
jgi:hypothetical protein